MAGEAQVHVILKDDISVHKALPLSSTLPPLKGDHVRVRTAIISLTNNNVSYALLGTALHWWAAYPVPADLQTPYNDTKAYGIVPAWGYGEILESKVGGLEPGMLLWGFWPTSSLPADLYLKSADVAGHFIEISEGRKNLWNLYQRYVLPDANARLASLTPQKVEEMAWEAAVRPVWEAGYLLNRSIFGKTHIHPANAGPWSKEDADLSAAVVVNLSASSKTGRAVTEALVSRRSEKLLGFMTVSSAAKSSLIPEATFPTKTVSYGDMIDNATVEWIRARQPKKIIIVDNGGRGDSLVRLHELFTRDLEGVEVVVIGVGGNPSISTAAELEQWAQRNTAAFDRIRMNTTAVKDAQMEVEGEQAYFDEYFKAWTAFTNSSCVRELKVELGNGIKGVNGFEGGWRKLREGHVPSDVALAYRI
jgi:hypothetical protein